MIDATTTLTCSVGLQVHEVVEAVHEGAHGGFAADPGEGRGRGALRRVVGGGSLGRWFGRHPADYGMPTRAMPPCGATGSWLFGKLEACARGTAAPSAR
ncbi:hypothetical protein Aave_3799 [Paracidovorax citrulli AAC00-1]|uniref:Uncharacterized protein n=1 Tax=Paracidovorax citrulli (strain AAC00-1) TaxID=397945 RepID=A1TTQ6_PARC0|nr:hypothetical protein Aave_3799 [Paracidovorax citrulli AAC00-1]